MGFDKILYDKLLGYAFTVLRAYKINVVDKADIVHEAWDFRSGDFDEIKKKIVNLAAKYSYSKYTGNHTEKCVIPNICKTCGSPILKYACQCQIPQIISRQKERIDKIRHTLEYKLKRRKICNRYTAKKKNDPIWREKMRERAAEYRKNKKLENNHSPISSISKAVGS